MDFKVLCLNQYLLILFIYLYFLHSSLDKMCSCNFHSLSAVSLYDIQIWCIFYSRCNFGRLMLMLRL